MEVTTKHSASSYGQPVILDDDGNVMDYGPGVKAIRKKLDLSIQEMANECGVSKRTVEGWDQGRIPATNALIVMARLTGSTL